MATHRGPLASTLIRNALGLILASALPPALAQPAMSGPEAAGASDSAAAQSFGLLRGKFPFTLPASYVGRELLARTGPPDSGNSWATMYLSDEDRQIVVVSEARNPSGTHVGDNDNIFLTGSAVGYNRQQQRAHPDYKVVSEKTLVIAGLGVRAIEATDIIDGSPALSTALLAASGTTLAIVQVISSVKDRPKHDALVARVLSGAQEARLSVQGFKPITGTVTSNMAGVAITIPTPAAT